MHFIFRLLGIKLIGLPKITNNKGIEIIKLIAGMFEAIYEYCWYKYKI